MAKLSMSNVDVIISRGKDDKTYGIIPNLSYYIIEDLVTNYYQENPDMAMCMDAGFNIYDIIYKYYPQNKLVAFVKRYSNDKDDLEIAIKELRKKLNKQLKKAICNIYKEVIKEMMKLPNQLQTRIDKLTIRKQKR